MGHNIGFPHYETKETVGCKCETGSCVMGKTAPQGEAKGFATCTQTDYEKLLNTGAVSCLLEYPEVSFLQRTLCSKGTL